jgi:lipid II:glycine glycyltransferase (peptidoglycan interpeptide bridge formation enzyme)
MTNDQSPMTKSHPFSGVTTFKTGFGGNLLELTHCVDLPLSPRYHVTRMVETVRKWKRGF